VVAAIIAGEEWHTVAKREGVSIGSISRWMDEAKSQGLEVLPREERPVNLATIEERRAEFNNALETFLLSSLKMLQAWTDVCTDPDFIRKNSHEAHELGQTILDRADKLVSLLRPKPE
jgi:hypothetical protein